MTQDNEWTLGRLLEWTTGYLAERGASSPRLDAEVLLAFARKCQRIELYTAFDETVDDQLRTVFRELVRRRAEGTPVAYLVESREFYSLPFRVTPAVLIPRPETEFLVIRLLDLAKEYKVAENSSLSIVDVGTGSGILAVCAAHHIPHSQILAIDIQADALEVARSNAETHQVAGRIEFLEGDLLDAVAENRLFDFVVSNPPYVSNSEYESLPAEIKLQEPRNALWAGETGTEVIQRLVPQAAERLTPGGWLLMEVSPMIAEPVRALLLADRRFEEVAVTKDLAKLPRVVEARRLPVG